MLQRLPETTASWTRSRTAIIFVVLQFIIFTIIAITIVHYVVQRGKRAVNTIVASMLARGIKCLMLELSSVLLQYVTQSGEKRCT